MAETGSSRGAASTTSLVLALFAFVAIGGLVYWLNMTAEPTAVEYTPEDTASEEEPVSDVPIVALEDLRADLPDFVNLEIEIHDQDINSLLGDQAFWIGPEDNPFLVKMDADAQEGIGSVSTEDNVDVRGRIVSMSDSILDAWEEEGVISGEGERAVASFAEVFMNANEVRSGDGEESDDEGAQEGGDDQEAEASDDGG